MLVFRGAFYLTDELQFSSSERESLKAKLLGWLVMGKPIKIAPFSPNLGDVYYTFDIYHNQLVVIQTNWEDIAEDYKRKEIGWVFRSSKHADIALKDIQKIFSKRGVY